MSAVSLRTAFDLGGMTTVGVGVTVEDGPVGGLAIIRAVRQHRGNRAIDLVEQRADQGGVALVRGGQLGGQDVAAVGIDGQVQPAPAAARLAAVLLMQPLARTEDLQARWSRSPH